MIANMKKFIKTVKEWFVELILTVWAWVVYQATKRRYIGKYPRFKKFVLVSALITVDGFILTILWGLVPKMETNFFYENVAIAAQEPQEGIETEESTVEPSKDCYEAVERFGGDNKDLIRRIVTAESSNNPKARSKTSTAAGCTQWIFGSWERYGQELWGDDFYSKSVYNPDDNVELAAWTVRNYGTSPWDASKANWSR
jgi:soluble lytic murein transglycosylase-like protein